MNLTNSSKRKITAIILGCLVMGVLLMVATTRGCAGGMPVEESVQRFAAAEVENIAIDSPAGKLSVCEARDDETEIVVTERSSGNASNVELKCTVENGTLTISQRLKPLAWLPIYWFSFGQQELEVAVPSEVFDRLQNFKLRNSSGDSQVSDLRCKTAEVNVSSGGACFANTTIEERAKLQLSSGSLDVDAANLGACELEVSSGNANVGGAMESLDLTVSSGHAAVACTNNGLSRANVRLTSGGIDLLLPKTAGFDAAVSKTSGGFTCQFDAAERGETYVYGDGSTPIDISITSGSMTLKPL